MQCGARWVARNSVMKERGIGNKKQNKIRTQIYMENSRWKKPRVEEKKIYYIKNWYKRAKMQAATTYA